MPFAQSASRNSFRKLSICLQCQKRSLSVQSSLFAPRHLLSIDSLSPEELTVLIRRASDYKTSIKSGNIPPALNNSLARKTIAMMFNKRSTRTRVSTESAITTMGGHSMFLGSSDIQLGVNETLHDTSKVISSMVAGIVSRVGSHSDIVDLAKYSSVPVINALSDEFHPFQCIADFLTIQEVFGSSLGGSVKGSIHGLGLQGMKIAWVGDANNVLYDMALGAAKLGVHVAVATPKGYEIPADKRDLILKNAESARSGMTLSETTVPEEAVKDADILVTDTWVSMGQEEETAKRLKAFQGFQITEDLASRGGAKAGWRFMHCLPRHPDEVSDEVFLGDRSLVFPEAENRLWAAIAVLEAFVVNKGKIL